MARTGVDHNTLPAQTGDIRSRVRPGNHHDGAVVVRVGCESWLQSGHSGLGDEIPSEISRDCPYPIGADLVQDVETAQLAEHRRHCRCTRLEAPGAVVAAYVFKMQEDASSGEETLDEG